MTALERARRRGSIRFDPREVTDSQPAIDLQWPDKRAEQSDLFYAWHAVAMQLIGEDGSSFRTIAVFPRFVHWRNGTIWATNGQLAEVAGGCHEKTIQRDIASYKRLQIIRDETVGQGRGKHPLRVLHLTLPRELNGRAVLPIAEFDPDNRCPVENPAEAPFDPDNRCPPPRTHGVHPPLNPLKGREL